MSPLFIEHVYSGIKMCNGKKLGKKINKVLIIKIDPKLVKKKKTTSIEIFTLILVEYML